MCFDLIVFGAPLTQETHLSPCEMKLYECRAFFQPFIAAARGIYIYIYIVYIYIYIYIYIYGIYIYIKYIYIYKTHAWNRTQKWD